MRPVGAQFGKFHGVGDGKEISSKGQSLTFCGDLNKQDEGRGNQEEHWREKQVASETSVSVVVDVHTVENVRTT